MLEPRNEVMRRMATDWLASGCWLYFDDVSTDVGRAA